MLWRLLELPNHFLFISLHHHSNWEAVIIIIRRSVTSIQLFLIYFFCNRFGARFHNKLIPGCKNLPEYTDEYWDCYIRHYTMTIYHMSGSVKMGPTSDPWAVVDPRLKVYGVKNLRVIDASIMPLITTGNINAPTIMIGEKGSDMIVEDWKS